MGREHSARYDGFAFSRLKMVRNYKRKTDRANISEQTMMLAVNAVLKDEQTVRQTAANFNIKKSTLFSRIKLYKKDGDPNASPLLENKENSSTSKYATRVIFNSKEEEALEDYLLHSSNIHYGLTYDTTRKLALEFAKKMKKTVPDSWIENGKAGKDWMMSFMKRHNKLSYRRPENTSQARASAFNKHNVGQFFDNLLKVQSKYNFTPDRVYNTDETGITTVLQAPKVIAPAGQKQVGQIVSGERGTLVTFCGIVSAIGATVPPIYIFPRQRMKEEYLYGAAPGAISLGSKTGWMTSELFPILLKHLQKYTNCNLEKPILLIIDNHTSHVSVQSIDYCRENGIILLSLPPHSTHKMQPLDICVYGPFKSRCKVSFNDYMATNPGKTIRIQDLAKLSADPYLLSFTPSNIINGFKKSGIWPINRQVFSDDDFLAAESTDRPLIATQIEESDRIQEAVPITSSMFAEDIADDIPQENEIIVRQLLDDIINSVCAEISESSPKTTLLSLRPYPKAGPRKATRVSKAGSSKIYTNSSEKKKLLEKELSKKEILARKAAKRKITSEVPVKLNAKKIRKPKSNTPLSESSDSDIQPDISPSDSDADISAEEDDNFPSMLTDENVHAGDYVLVKFSTKKTLKHYVGLVTLILDNEEYEVKFLRKNTAYGFSYPYTDDISTVPREDIVSKLPPPKETKTTSRLKNYISFDVNFVTFNMC